MSSHIQEGFTAITPYIYGNLALVDFLKNAFGAQITHDPSPDAAGHFHAEAKIGGASLMIGSGYFTNPSMAAGIYLYVPDVDVTYEKAMRLGATSVRDLHNETWGDRVGGVKDQCGNTWWIATFKGSK